MKLRGINPIERHAEKLFFGAVVLVFLGVLAMQFVGQGNVVRVDQRKDVPLDKAYSEVAQKAEEKLGAIRATAVAPEANQPVPDAVSQFTTALTAPVAPAKQIATPLGPGRGGEQQTGPGLPVDGRIRVAIAPLPAPTAPAARTFGVTLDPVLVASMSELSSAAPALPAKQPYDLHAVTIEATFSADDLLAALRLDPDGAGEAQKIPDLWWMNSLAVLDVEVVRQQLDPDGAPGPESVLPPLPGRTSLRASLSGLTTPRELQALTQRARDDAQSILKPRWYASIAGEPWLPPSKDAGAAKQDAAGIVAKRKRIQDIDREVEQLTKSLEARQSARPVAPFGRDAVAGPSGPGRGGPTRAPGRQEDPEQRKQQQEQQRQQAIQKRIDDLKQERDTLSAQLAAAGFGADGATGPDPGEQALAEPVARLKDGGTVRVWAHDISARPGETYRYKVRLVLPNPLFGYGQNIAEDLISLTESTVLRTPDSTWSEPIEVDRDSYLFVTSASRSAALAGGGEQATATSDVYRFFYGFWRKDTVTLQPGDTATGRVDLGAFNLPIFTISPASAGGFTSLPGEALTGPFGFDVQGWYLLQVTPAPLRTGAGRTEFQAVLLAPDGQIVTRDPSLDARSPRRERLERSVEAGKAAVVRTPTGESALGAPASASGDGAAGAPADQAAQPTSPEDQRDQRPPTQPGTTRRIGGG